MFRSNHICGFSDHINEILPQKGVGPLSRFGCRSLHIDAGKDFSVNVVVHLVFIQDFVIYLMWRIKF